LIRQAIEKTLELNPQHPEALMRMARLLWKAGKLEQAFEQLSLAMQYGRNDPLVQSMLATWALRISGLDSALDLQHRATMLDPVNFAQFINLSYFLYMSGQLDESAEALRQASEIKSDIGMSGNHTLALIAIEQQDYELAESLAQDFLEGSMRDYLQGMLQHQAGNEEAANAALQRLMEYDDLESRTRLAYVYGYRGEVDDAFRTLHAVAESMAAIHDCYIAEILFMELQTSRFLQALHGDRRWLEWTRETEALLHHPYYDRLAESLQWYAATGNGIGRVLSQEKMGGL
jgi:Flp pilus assembly protein TadD